MNFNIKSHNITYQYTKIAFTIYLLLLISCINQDTDSRNNNYPPIPGKDIVQLPIVIHIIHNGEDIGEGPNLSTSRILRQIEIINEDFRRKKDTNGFNDHPDSDDSKIEFVLAKRDPNSKPINGINRINTNDYNIDDLGYNQNHYAQYAYWDPNQYINIWVTPLPISTECLVLGSSTGPKTDLPGTHHLQLPGPNDAEGILINWIHFGESSISCHAKYGRTLTHELGHYFGLLHPWGGKYCDLNDYCDDTPAVNREIFGNTAFIGCDGEEVMIQNYMNYSHDEIMNIFTKDQIYRMHYVLKNHTGRNKLMTSSAL